MWYVKAVSDEEYKFVKFTCRFGMYHGRIVLTEEQGEARKWTRQADAARAAQTANARVATYSDDKEKFGAFRFDAIKLL